MTGLRPIPLRRQCFPSAPRGHAEALARRPELKSVRQRAQELPSSAMSDGLGHVAAALAIVPVDTMAPFWGAHTGARVEAATAADEFMWIRRDVHSTARVGWLGRVVRRQERTVAPVPIGSPVIHEATSLASSRVFSTTHSTN
jgi:hypothetical protein